MRLIDGDRLKRIMMQKGIESGRLKLSTVINEIELAPAIEAEHTHEAESLTVYRKMWQMLESVLQETTNNEEPEYAEQAKEFLLLIDSIKRKYSVSSE